jgi:hypothetical protein
LIKIIATTKRMNSPSLLFGAASLIAFTLGAYVLETEETDIVIDSVAQDITRTLAKNPPSLRDSKEYVIQSVCAKMRENRYDYVGYLYISYLH